MADANDTRLKGEIEIHIIAASKREAAAGARGELQQAKAKARLIKDADLRERMLDAIASAE